MPSFLLITLAAPMASFGREAGHERRGSAERPAHSALVGLLGAALGIRRDDFDQQRALAETVETAVRVDNPGQPMQDFHTAQYVPTARIKRPNSRREALLALTNKDNPEITRRDYRMDVCFTAAYRPLAKCLWSLEKMADALREPFFTLYLGRKSCPLSLPVSPRIIAAEDILTALQHNASLNDKEKLTVLSKTVSPAATRPYVVVSSEAKIHTTNLPPRLERINDRPLDRRRWHFTARHEAIYPLPEKREEQA